MELRPKDYAHFSTGDTFRALTSSNNAVGNYMKDKIDHGRMINDDIVVSMFHTYLLTILDGDYAMLLDGYPRSLEQAKDLLQMSIKYERQLLGIYFELSPEKAKERIMSRGRNDDNEEVIDYRIKHFFEEVEPVIDYFDKNGVLVRVDADQDIKKVFSDFVQIV
jgi:adenylate kinase